VHPAAIEDYPPDGVLADQSLRRNNSTSQIYHPTHYPTLTSDRQPPLIAPQIPGSLEELHKLSTSPQLLSKPSSTDMGNTAYLDEHILPLYSSSRYSKLSIESMQQDFKKVASRRTRTMETPAEERLDPS
jgi:hypothetical protein